MFFYLFFVSPALITDNKVFFAFPLFHPGSFGAQYLGLRMAGFEFQDEFFNSGFISLRFSLYGTVRTVPDQPGQAEPGGGVHYEPPVAYSLYDAGYFKRNAHDNV
ncbi:MAG: hypothetical protein A2270_04935 [Elusimicrobia bacterium RIFOXYA12_FULL_51_18]|nr:MAG: hypothetical protein A2270_04935 [Elusimicrobia bacterium RIFOXYA12_FULL_51_18]OGS30966.1 MAG: hypothetical protein A2218_07660 [Elusimicrobia bacterium RIFOXYA2_FULL_53_38]